MFDQDFDKIHLPQRRQVRLDTLLRLRWFAFAIPAISSAAYFAGVLATGGTWWSIHLVAGSIVISGLAGWLLSYLVFPVPGPGERPELV